VLGHADGGRLARSTYLRPVDGIGEALPDNVIPLRAGQRMGNGTPMNSGVAVTGEEPGKPAATEHPRTAAKVAHDL